VLSLTGRVSSLLLGAGLFLYFVGAADLEKKSAVLLFKSR